MIISRLTVNCSPIVNNSIAVLLDDIPSLDYASVIVLLLLFKSDSDYDGKRIKCHPVSDIIMTYSNEAIK